MANKFLAETIGVSTECGLSMPIVKAGLRLPYYQGQWMFSVTDKYQEEMNITILLGNRARASDNRLIGNLRIPQTQGGYRGVPCVSLSFFIQKTGELLISAENLKTGSVHHLRSSLDTSDKPAPCNTELVEDIRFKEFARTGMLARKMIRSNTMTLKKADKVDEHSRKVKHQMSSVIKELEQTIQAGSDLQQLQLLMNDLSQLSLQFHFAAYTNPIRMT